MTGPWPVVALQDVASDERRSITDGPFGSNLTSAHYTDSGPRVVRLQNIGDGKFIDAEAHISPEHFEALRAHEVAAGDLLVASLGEVLPRACLAPASLGPAIVKADCIRVRLNDNVNPLWVLRALQRPAARRWADSQRHGVGRPRLGLKIIRQTPIPLPDRATQDRVVEIIEEHFSHLDAADSSLALAARRAARLRASSLWQATHRLPGAQVVPLEAIAEVRLGRQRSPKNHTGDRMRPYLRAANVDWNRLRLDDVLEMHFTEKEEATYRLEAGDILLTEASGSPAEVGKSVLYRGDPADVCFQNTLLRVRAHGALPEFVQKYLLAEAYAGRFMPEARGVGINHLGRARLASLDIELPPRAEQGAAIARCDEVLDRIEQLEVSVAASGHRSAALRRAVLVAAFDGRLTGASSDGDTIEEIAANG